ncbi:MAG: xanthine dehydrogenase family protein molybdopterin-binding subunit [Hyphomonadaceae bacterium]|nr:xanthine dehydrogenase family protein molybdopterin-binding subunit [Hyphomonadaceae bacterium]
MGKWTRRGFIATGLVTGGALAVGVAIRPGHRGPKLAGYVVDGDEKLLVTWVKVHPDNTVTAIIPHGEMGQGVHTALGAMLAEEMDADWDNLQVMEAPAEKAYANFVLAREFILGDKAPEGWVLDTVNGAFLTLTKSMNLQITGGSTSVRFTGKGAMQTAGAAAREMIMKAAAREWGVPVSSLRTEKSHVYGPDGQSAPYGEFVERAAGIKPSISPRLKARKDYVLMGQSLPRIDLPGKVDGSAKFSIDAQVPGMKYATVKAAPVLGNKVKSMDAREARSMPGVINVLDMGGFVAVIADGYWQAKQAMDFVHVEFESSDADTCDDATLSAQYNQALDTGKQKTWHRQGDVKKAAGKAALTYSADYRVPFLAHACMEPMNATAWVRDGKCDIWTGTQNPLGTRAATAETLGMDFDNVRVHTAFMGGGFGRRATPDYSNQAARISQQTGLPVKLIWSREEDIQQDHYRPSAVSRLSASLDGNKMPTGWDSLFTHRMDPEEAALCIYDIPNQSIRYVESPSHIRFGPWRSVDHTQHGFFTESFIDELAHNAGKDPYAFRRALLKSRPRHRRVLDTAANMADWGAPLPEGRARGIAIVDSFMTVVAEVVTVDVTGPEPRVLHVACAADAGMAVNPDGFRAQMESGIIYGLTSALYGQISITDGAVDQSNFHDYRMIRMNNAPGIDVEIIQSDAPLGGAGEPGTPPVTPAFTNAIYAATARRIRELPVMNHDFGGVG